MSDKDKVEIVGVDRESFKGTVDINDEVHPPIVVKNTNQLLDNLEQ